ncbi:hypothetical protein EON63_14870 [archaeon]|nr:MAG: hypothetical protein EON63_14870 [archaeon]
MFPFISGFTAALTFIAFYRLLTHVPSSPLLTHSKRRKVVLFGDSITQHGYNTEISGWVAMFSHYWSRRADVVNRGFSG